MIEELVKALLGAIAAPIATWIFSKIPVVRRWLSGNSPSYIILVASTTSALLVTVGFMLYLDIMRRQEIAFLKNAGGAVAAAVNESRIAKDQGSQHAVFALEWAEKTQRMISNRMDKKIENIMP